MTDEELIERLETVRVFIEQEYRDDAAQVEGEWLAKEARKPHQDVCEVIARLRELTGEHQPAASDDVPIDNPKLVRAALAILRAEQPLSKDFREQAAKIIEDLRVQNILQHTALKLANEDCDEADARIRQLQADLAKYRDLERAAREYVDAVEEVRVAYETHRTSPQELRSRRERKWLVLKRTVATLTEQNVAPKETVAASDSTFNSALRESLTPLPNSQAEGGGSVTKHHWRCVRRDRSCRCIWPAHSCMWFEDLTEQKGGDANAQADVRPGRLPEDDTAPPSHVGGGQQDGVLGEDEYDKILYSMGEEARLLYEHDKAFRHKVEKLLEADKIRVRDICKLTEERDAARDEVEGLKALHDRLALKYSSEGSGDCAEAPAR